MNLSRSASQLPQNQQEMSSPPALCWLPIFTLHIHAHTTQVICGEHEPRSSPLPANPALCSVKELRPEIIIFLSNSLCLS